MSGLRFERVDFAHGEIPVLEGIDFEAPVGKITAIMGPSGCGKSTLIALAAGLLEPDRGRVVRDSRRLAVAFQDPALLPWKTARDNVAFALLGEGQSRGARRVLAEAALDRVGLTGEATTRYPGALSGGMRQRVALARALVVRPDLLFCDEPFAALDADARGALQGVLRAVQAEAGLTTLLVTHDRAEALALADVVVLMSMGRIERMGTPQEVLSDLGETAADPI